MIKGPGQHGPTGERPLPEWRPGDPMSAEKLNGPVRVLNQMAGFRGAQQVTPARRGGSAATVGAGDPMVVGYVRFFSEG